MRMKRILGVAALAAVLMGAVAAQAATYYVDVSWAGTPSGTQTEPFRTISNAVEVANASAGPHTVYLAGGIYADVANGGLENFSEGGGTGGGYGLTELVHFYGGYAGWDGLGTDPENFDWTAGARVPRSTIIDLQAAASRAFFRFESGDGSSPWYDGLTFRNANHTANGGAIHHDTGYNRNVNLRNCLFTNNVTTGEGGAVYMGGSGNSQIVDSEFVGNQGSNGGAVRWTTGLTRTYRIDSSTFTDNTATGSGGAVNIDLSTTFTITDSVFTGNSAGSSAGAFMASSSRTTIERSVFSNNSAPSGAAVGGNAYHGGNYTLINCLVVNNSGGYAIENQHRNVGTPVIDLRHCTVADNSGGGVMWNTHANAGAVTIHVRNSILSGNGNYGIYQTKTSDPDPTLTYNNVQGHVVADYHQCSEGDGSISEDPEFVDASGGNYRLAKGSPCIDTAADLGITTDLDGVARPTRDGFDMGAYEEWELPAVAHRYPMAQVSEVTPRIVLSHQPDGFPTDAWIVLDTEDKVTSAVTEWSQFVKIETPAAGEVFGHTFTGLTADTDYVYRVWVSNDYDNAWGELGEVRTLADGAPLQLLWTPTSANLYWSTGAAETNWTANAGMTLTPWVHGASAVFEGLPATAPRAQGGGMQFNSIKLTGVASGTLTINKLSGDDNDHLVAVGDALIDAPAGTTITLPQVRGSVGLTLTGGGTLTFTRSRSWSGGTTVLNGTFQAEPPGGMFTLLDTAGSASARLNLSGVNSSWTRSNHFVVRGGSTGTATVQNSTSTGGPFNPTISGNLSLTNALSIIGDSRTAVFTLGGDIEGLGNLQYRYDRNSASLILNGDGAMHRGALVLQNPSSRTGLTCQLNGTRGNANITVGVNIAVSGTGTLMCNIDEGVADRITLGNNATIDLSGLTLEPIDPVRTPGEYPIISPKSRVTGEFAAVVGKFEIAYDGTDTYPDDVVLIVPAPPGSLFLLR